MGSDNALSNKVGAGFIPDFGKYLKKDCDHAKMAQSLMLHPPIQSIECQLNGPPYPVHPRVDLDVTVTVQVGEQGKEGQSSITGCADPYLASGLFDDPASL